MKAQQLLIDEIVHKVEEKVHEWIYGESFIYSVIVQSLQQRTSLIFENRGADREKLQALKEYHELGSLHTSVLPNFLCFVTSIACSKGTTCLYTVIGPPYSVRNVDNHGNT